VFVVADWRAIEARMNPWLSNEPDADAVLDVFRSGRDIYIKEAAGIYKVPEDQVTPDQRFIGKVASLACGYGGGLGAFTAMGRAYGLVTKESDSKRTVDAWRRANVWAVRYWQNLETAYTRAMRNANKEFHAGRVTYLFDGQHLWYALPSGRILCYPFAKLENDGVTYAKASWKPDAKAENWPRARLWKGLAAENICQAAANDILRATLRSIPDCVLHVHDEVVIQCSAGEAEKRKAALERVMVTAPTWGAGLPLDVEIKIMSKYGK
jgi:DNA polymerase